MSDDLDKVVRDLRSGDYRGQGDRVSAVAPTQDYQDKDADAFDDDFVDVTPTKAEPEAD